MMSKHYGDHRAQTATPAVSLRERPEQAHFHISFSIETETISAALGMLKRAALRLDELAAPTQSTVVVERFDLPPEPGKPDAARAGAGRKEAQAQAGRAPRAAGMRGR